MTVIREAIRNLLIADSAIAAITTADRIFDAENFDVLEGVIPNTVRGTNLEILPFMVLRFAGSQPTDPNWVDQMARRTLTVYIYNGRGYTTVETLKERVKQLLRNQFITGSDMGVCKCLWGGDLGEFTAPEMEHAYFDAVTFQLIGWEN